MALIHSTFGTSVETPYNLRVWTLFMLRRFGVGALAGKGTSVVGKLVPASATPQILEVLEKRKRKKIN